MNSKQNPVCLLGALRQTKQWMMANGAAAAERKMSRIRLILNRFYGNSEAGVENFKPNYDLYVFYL